MGEGAQATKTVHGGEQDRESTLAELRDAIQALMAAIEEQREEVPHPDQALMGGIASPHSRP